MLFPTISEYKTAVRNALKTLRTLKDYEPVLRPDGEPLFYSGGLAAVFKLKHRETGKFLALKCFHKDQENREARYKLISECLIDYPSNYLVHYDYKDNEIFVNSSVAGNRGYPVLAMEWAEGLTMGEFVSQCCHKRDEAALNRLVDEFNWFTFWLLSQPFAHGDLKPDNIMIRPDGKPVLLDYDGMYVPTMKGQDASELGSPVYRHPARTVRDFNKRMDDFSLIILLLELRILSANPQSYRGIGESLFLTQEDIRLAAMPKLAAVLDLKAENWALHLLRQLEALLQPGAAKPIALPELLLRYLRKTPLPIWEPELKINRAVPEPEMVFVQGGTFEMGSKEQEDEQPVHKVTLSDFYLAKTPVTFAEYDLFCAAISADRPDYKGRGLDQHPVSSVSWYDAVEYCNWLSVQHGFMPAYSIDKMRKDPGNHSDADDQKWIVTSIIGANGYRLPTEAEWEYAARGGNQSKGYKYAGSNSLDEVGWYHQNSGSQPHPVAQKKPNELGLYDMSGNVWEWCWDWYGRYSTDTKKDYSGPPSGKSRVLCGGSWGDFSYFCRSAIRVRINPDFRSLNNGFRVSRHLK
jgi:formylglycine-generating enzyme required for sulfatase activity